MKKEIELLTEYITKDYQGNRIINQMDVFSQIDTKEILSILDDLFKIVYPGYFLDTQYRFYDIKSKMTIIIEEVYFKLRKQIELALPQDPAYASVDETELKEKAKEISLRFLETIPKIREYLETDVLAFYDGDPAAYNYSEIIQCYPGIYTITINRIAHELYLLGVPLIPRMMTEHAHSKTGIDIHPGASIGKYFFIDHGTGIVIGETTQIGNHVKIYQGVTIGALSTSAGIQLKGKKRHPTIEDDVIIYSGASILGGNTVIGKGSVIGGNAFITSSVEAGGKIYTEKQ